MGQAVFFIHTDQLAEHGRYGSTKDELEATEVVLGTRKHNGGAPRGLLQAIARSTACSSRVFYGLLAWANLNAQMADASSL